MISNESRLLKKLGIVFVMLFLSFILIACRGGKKNVPATSIELSEGELEMVVGDTETVTATVLPENATDKTVTWTTSDEDVATVNNGTITAVGAGEATITATCGSVSAHVEVTVVEPEPETYTVEFDEKGGSKVDDQVVTAGQKATKPADPTKKDKTFGGWYTDSNLTQAFDFNTPINSNLTLYAKWLDNYEVLFYAEGVEYIDPLVVAEGQLVTKPKIRREGYTVYGWYTDPNFTNEFDFNTPITNDLTLYARWNQVYTYTIEYHLNGGENNPENNITVYSIFDLPIALHEPTREGYTFLGWYGNEYFTFGPFDEIDYGQNYDLYAKWEINEKVDTYANPELAGTANGTVVTYKDMEFVVGETAFAKLSDAVAASSRYVYVVGTHEEDVTINASDITILGPNANVDPNKATRNPEAVIKGKITLSGDLENITFNGLAFTGNGRITNTAGVKNFKFIYNYVYDTTDATTAWQETAGYTSGFLAFANGNDNKLVDFTFKFNKFSNVSDVNINFARVTNVYVKNNTFLNFDRDAIRFDTGGFNQGNLIFDNNVFSNDTLGGYNGIYFRIYGGDQIVKTVIEITNNTFKNIGKAQTTYSGAISMRNYQEKCTDIKILYNTFEKCENYIHIRNNGTAYNHQNYPWTAVVNHNKFVGVPTTYYYRNWTGSDNATSNPTTMNFDKNLYLDNSGNVITDLSAHSAKFMNLASYKDNYQTVAAYDEVIAALVAGVPTAINVKNKITSLVALTEHQLEIEVTPANSDDDVTYLTSDAKVATVTADGKIKALTPGKVTITVVSNLNEDVFTSFEFEVVPKQRIEVRYEGNGALLVNQVLELSAEIYNLDETEIVWTSSDNDIASVDANGVVTAKSSGTVLITATVKDTQVSTQVGLTVYGNEITDEFLLYLISINTGVVTTEELYYIGSDSGNGDFLNRIYTSVSDYHFGDIEIIENWLPATAKNWNGPDRKINIEFITIHDTAGSAAGSTAQANSGWCTNPSNTKASWHYTVGNDGVYQQIEDDVRAWHAGDGSRPFELLDTGVKAEGEGKPVITINEKGYYVINGVQSKIMAPIIAQINRSGIYTTVGENGNYWMNKTYFNTDYRLISNHGGNDNSIGIESAVNNGSDVYFTWHRLAKLVAGLLVEHDLGIDRVMYHNNFSGKPCPRTMLTAGLVPEFETLVQAEYKVATEFSDYEVEFTSHNPDIVDNTGRVIGRPLETTNVTYTIKVTKDGQSQSITLNALVPGQYTW